MKPDAAAQNQAKREIQMQAFNQDEEKQPGVGELKRGDYIIHVFVERGKDFKSDEDFIDPIIEVSSLG